MESLALFGAILVNVLSEKVYVLFIKEDVMRNMRYGMIVMSLLLFSVVSVKAQVHIGIGLPKVSIGINLPIYPNPDEPEPNN